MISLSVINMFVSSTDQRDLLRYLRDNTAGKNYGDIDAMVMELQTAQPPNDQTCGPSSSRPAADRGPSSDCAAILEDTVNNPQCFRDRLRDKLGLYNTQCDSNTISAQLELLHTSELLAMKWLYHDATTVKEDGYVSHLAYLGELLAASRGKLVRIGIRILDLMTKLDLRTAKLDTDVPLVCSAVVLSGGDGHRCSVQILHLQLKLVSRDKTLLPFLHSKGTYSVSLLCYEGEFSRQRMCTYLGYTDQTKPNTDDTATLA